MTAIEQATNYARSIRNAVKRQYAMDILRNRVGIIPDEPARPADLSYMAAQAVEMTLGGILDREDGTPWPLAAMPGTATHAPADVSPGTKMTGPPL